MNWRYQAACRTQDPELFFPSMSCRSSLIQAREAKAVCCHCPVIEECLQWALRSSQEYGIWGGLSEAERRALRRRIATRQQARRSAS
ncbi:WhiB family transcriptional regulator [Streptomyces kronopolitis]|uniref:WhiB family transcriptional regulator n=1 Tax=Streptomyces kronopolitis TaxID=1612435 RepID=UPI0036A9153C